MPQGQPMAMGWASAAAGVARRVEPGISVTDLPERLLCLTHLFPDDVALLATLISQDADFSSLCEDLALSVDVLRRLEEEEQTTNAVRKAEYRMIFEQLQREVRSSLFRFRK